MEPTLQILLWNTNGGGTSGQLVERSMASRWARRSSSSASLRRSPALMAALHAIMSKTSSSGASGSGGRCLLTAGQQIFHEGARGDLRSSSNTGKDCTAARTWTQLNHFDSQTIRSGCHWGSNSTASPQSEWVRNQQGLPWQIALPTRSFRRLKHHAFVQSMLVDDHRGIGFFEHQEAVATPECVPRHEPSASPVQNQTGPSPRLGMRANLFPNPPLAQERRW